MKIKEDNAVKKIITNLISLITIISMLSSSAVSAMEKMSNEQLESIFYDWLHNYSLKTYATDDWVYDTTINEIYSSTEVDEEGDPELLAYEMVYEITEYKNKNATSVVIPSSIDGKKIYSVIRPTFETSKNIKKVTYSNGIKVVDVETFENHKKLQEVILPTSITYIGLEAFHNCKNLKKVKLPNNVYIDQGAFKNCKELKSLNFKGTSEFTKDPDILTITSDISKEAFANCVKLEKINLEIEGIEKKAFYNCKSLSKVTFKNAKKAPYVGKNAFNKTKNGIKFFVKNKKVANQLKKQLKKSGVKNAKILIGKKVVYQNING